MEKNTALFFILHPSWDFWAFYSIFEHSKNCKNGTCQNLAQFLFKIIIDNYKRKDTLWI
jgi:hypothetical protein